jgi:hypothetical protein
MNPATASAGRKKKSSPPLPSVSLTAEGMSGDLRATGLSRVDVEAIRTAWLFRNRKSAAPLRVSARGLEIDGDLEFDRKLAVAMNKAFPDKARVAVKGAGHHLTFRAGGGTFRHVRFSVSHGDLIVTGGGSIFEQCAFKVRRGSAYIGGSGSLVMIGSELHARDGVHVGERRLYLHVSKVVTSEGNFSIADGGRILVASSRVESARGFAAPPRSVFMMSGSSKITSKQGELGFVDDGGLGCTSNPDGSAQCSYSDRKRDLILSIHDGATRTIPHKKRNLIAEWDFLLGKASQP